MEPLNSEIKKIADELKLHAGMHPFDGVARPNYFDHELSKNSALEIKNLEQATGKVVELIQSLNVIFNGKDADNRGGDHLEWLPWEIVEAVTMIFVQSRRFLVRPPKNSLPDAVRSVAVAEYTILFVWGNLLAGDISDVRIGIEMALSDLNA